MSELGNGTQGAVPLRVILHIYNFWLVLYLCLVAVSMLWATEMGETWTHDINGRQLPLVTEPQWKCRDSLLYAMGPHLPGLTMEAPKSWEELGMLAGVADCGRSEKWGWRGRFMLGFKLRHGSHMVWNHMVLGEPHSFGAPFASCLRKQERQCSSRDRDNMRPCREGKGWKDTCWWTMRRCNVGLD